MQSFSLSQLLASREQVGQRWQEFLRTPSLSMGVYHLAVGQIDEQRPHTEDEVYYVVQGKASFRTGAHYQRIEPGSILYVQRMLEHQFVDITEDLTVLVFFAPAEGTLANREEG